MTNERLAELQAKYPAWDLWFVSQVYGPGTWCAKPAGAKLATGQQELSRRSRPVAA